jgi:hypothetical protein
MTGGIETTYVGGKVFVTIRPEATYGTYDAAGTDIKWVLGQNFTNPRKNNMQKVYGLGSGRNPAQIVPGKYEVDGTLEFDVQNGRALHLALGDIGWWGWAGSTWTRTLGIASPTYHPAYDLDGVAITGTPTALNLFHVREADTMPPFSVSETLISAGTVYDSLLRYVGCKVNGWNVDADTERPLRATFDWMGRTDSIVTDQSTITEPTTPGGYTDAIEMFYRGTLSFGGTAVIPTADTYSGLETAGPAVVTTPAAIVACNSISAKLTNNMEKYFSITTTAGRGVQYLLEKQREYTLNLELNYVHNDFLKRFYDGTITASSPTGSSDYTPFYVTVDYKTANTLGNSFKQLRLVFSQVYFDETNIPASPMDILKEPITAIAKKCDAFYITNEAQ